MNKNLIQMFLLFIFFVILFHVVNYVYFANKENMDNPTTPANIQSNAIANYINQNIPILTDAINKISPQQMSALVNAFTNAINNNAINVNIP